jgi:hypothetical protein
MEGPSFGSNVVLVWFAQLEPQRLILRRFVVLQFEVQRFVVEKLGPQRPIPQRFVVLQFEVQRVVVEKLGPQRPIPQRFVVPQLEPYRFLVLQLEPHTVGTSMRWKQALEEIPQGLMNMNLTTGFGGRKGQYHSHTLTRSLRIK